MTTVSIRFYVVDEDAIKRLEELSKPSILDDFMGVGDIDEIRRVIQKIRNGYKIDVEVELQESKIKTVALEMIEQALKETN